MFQAKINVTLKKSVFDPQGKTVLDALHSLGFGEAEDVRVGKYFKMTLKAKDKAAAEKEVKAICDKLLINPVIEEYQFQLAPLESDQ
ncbi:MAG: phosphoribosylformylglycinamidine synthase [Candidatus Omnitrophica bacterium CG11_big_fil_rev_8_21_14_0_20_45_26]|uniref:Phosphoribosylformylglycinamidine synthase subunit PurS n=1 Tax=Candidatus Abzuiibacterium crystallinum TaxID=1974748 RepID=A0A2H0LP60_9BACT|nr:MAG: phosphoribosylformylglycinamidine synthase [Candidatus Omnitrophica bacterium CG11_big_fil_rev_8_21_14_0_20_45_26]PIW65253.1 MAG: phosphoribosylformylglycinamidine synthase [Candidatus Omnitrophica bacterium CG12_big_fil_rev_8_21_14_0_65_45_16]